jgi:Cdc6-like AAA superfamily ATPase
MTVEEAKEDVVNILDRQTIKRVRRECERLAREKDLPEFEAFLEEGTHFILTDKRADILHGVHDGLASQDSPGVILHGAYGSGKTVMMENIELLCDSSQEFGGHEFNQLHYGETPIDCITISLEQNDTPTDFLYAIFQALVDHSDSVDTDDLIAIFNDRKINLTIEDLDDTLPPSQRENLIDRFEDPDSLEDIARVSKSLTAGDAHKPITWFTTYYLDREDRYPALYIDEFEQLFRQGVDPGGTYRLKAIIQKMIRNAVSGFDNLDTPPYILFANTLSLDELTDRFSAERDLIDRITESVSYNIDLSEDETKELFAKLYRLYVIPLLADRDGDAQRWYDTPA